MLSLAYYANNYASIIDTGLVNRHSVKQFETPSYSFDAHQWPLWVCFGISWHDRLEKPSLKKQILYTYSNYVTVSAWTVQNGLCTWRVFPNPVTFKELNRAPGKVLFMTLFISRNLMWKTTHY